MKSCQWKNSCYEFSAAIKDKAHMLVVVGPQIPLIPEYHSLINLYPIIKDLVVGKFFINNNGTEIICEDWKELLEVIRKESFKGSHLQRYKGLGEMNPDQLWSTTMDPEKRTILQVSLENAAEADHIFSTLMGDEVEPRRIFIETNAKYVKNLDV
jgi:DNA gyrase subunit B